MKQSYISTHINKDGDIVLTYCSEMSFDVLSKPEVIIIKSEDTEPVIEAIKCASEDGDQNG